MGQFMSYGSMKETSAAGQQTGDFSAKDIAVGGSFAYALSEHFSGGMTAKMVASYIGQYNSLGAAVDLGLNYYDAESELSASLVAWVMICSTVHCPLPAAGGISLNTPCSQVDKPTS